MSLVTIVMSLQTPKELFEKLRDLDFPTIVIPHGNTWGFYTPPMSSLDKQLEADFNDDNLQILFEVMSGHGNSEEYRPWRALIEDQEGNLICPEPSDDYLSVAGAWRDYPRKMFKQWSFRY